MKQRLTVISAAISMLVFALATPPGALHTFELEWVIGKVVVPYKGSHVYQSTGFVFKHKSIPYVITTNHTVEKIKGEYGKDARIFIKLPIIEDPLPLRPVFTEPSEDSAVFSIDRLPPGYESDTLYETALSLSKGDSLVIKGYPEKAHARHEPEEFPASFLTLATLNFRTDRLSLPPHLEESDSAVILTGCAAPVYGISGSPVFKPDFSALVGMVKSFGSSRKDRRLSEMLGASEFHIIVRLDRTIERIMELDERR
jgi:hypothetical protein